MQAQSNPTSTYRERRLARAERLREWAEKREAKAVAAAADVHRRVDAIPLGQPILVGHHSERRHRRDLARIDSSIQKAHEHGQMAHSMRSRAANIEAAADNAIYSDDHDACERLAEKIATLEAERDRIKAYNATCRKGSPDRSLLVESDISDLETCLKYAAYQCKGGAFPSYKLSNLNGNIGRLRKRLEQLSSLPRVEVADPYDAYLS